MQTSVIAAATAFLLGAAPAAADAAAGKAVYAAKTCSLCHGGVGQGGAAGPRLAPDPLPFEVFLKRLREPLNEMPPFGPAIVSDQEARAIHDYLASIKPGAPAEAIPLLKERLPAR
jgi:mono/diheme cytochrome c family protein